MRDLLDSCAADRCRSNPEWPSSITPNESVVWRKGSCAEEWRSERSPIAEGSTIGTFEREVLEGRPGRRRRRLDSLRPQRREVCRFQQQVGRRVDAQFREHSTAVLVSGARADLKRLADLLR